MKLKTIRSCSYCTSLSFRDYYLRLTIIMNPNWFLRFVEGPSTAPAAPQQTQPWCLSLLWKTANCKVKCKRERAKCQGITALLSPGEDWQRRGWEGGGGGGEREEEKARGSNWHEDEMREWEKDEEVGSSYALSPHAFGNAFRWDLADVFPALLWDFHCNRCHVKHKHIQQHQRSLGRVETKPLAANLLACSMRHGCLLLHSVLFYLV